MRLPPLTIIPAGAGSGKTYTIQKQLGEWIANGEVGADRVVAVTFTEAAAAELRERISTELLAIDRIEDALRLDQAYISTIHGFGLRVLAEFAFEAGSSPRPRLLNDNEKNALTRMALARTESVNFIAANLAAFGYRYDFNSGSSAEDALRADVLRVVDKLREIGWRPGDPLDLPAVLERIRASYGPVEDGDELGASLRQSAQALLAAFPEAFDREFSGNKTAQKELLRDFRNIKSLCDSPTADSNWKLWNELRKMRRSKRGAQLPAGYDELADAVLQLAERLPRHPGPLAQACRHIEALLTAGQHVLVEYETAKRNAGLVDYSDMVALAGKLLRDRPEVLRELASRIDCLVIDEFQDTNPIQFALLWQLKEAGVPTMIVGDLKQAIMGFQGADPRLFAAILDQHAAITAPLTRNWRSQPPLMEFINALGPGLFGDDYITLSPQAQSSLAEPLEVITFPSKARKAQKAVCAYALGSRLRVLLADPSQEIIDRHTKVRRRLCGGDIAVLCPTHSTLAIYADTLRAQGLRVRLPADGWFQSRAVQLAYHALAYLANPADRHAALYLAVTELGSLSLQEGLEQLMAQDRVDDPVLRALDELAAGVVDRTIYTLVADTFRALNFFDVAATWPDADQARANLLRLQAEAGEFMDANREALAYGGFHGSGIQTFLAWLAAKIEERDGDKQPDSRVLDQDAIVLSTWHSAKGREWPVVAVCGLDQEIKARLPRLEIGYSSFDDLLGLLEHARIEYSPGFDAPETNERFMVNLQAAAEVEARRLLYVALTRPRDKLILEWPAFLGAAKASTKPKTSYWSILSDSCALVDRSQGLAVGETKFASVVIDGGNELPEEPLATGAEQGAELTPIGRRAINPGRVGMTLTPDSRTPSGLEHGATPVADDGVPLELITYGEALEVGAGPGGVALGTVLHRCFEVLGARPQLLDRMPLITGMDIQPALLTRIAASVGRFEDWLNDHFGASSVLREWPLLALGDDGAVISGTADLVVETAEGTWVIDHKSDRKTDSVGAFHVYQPQLEAYAAMLERAGRTVIGVGVHWIRRGEVVLQRR